MATTTGGHPAANLIGTTAKGAKSILCYRAMMPTSAGVWLGDNPLHFSLPILLYQITIIFILSHLTHVILSRFGQPLIISQIMAGVLLGPAILGQNLKFEKLFARQSFEQLNTISTFSFIIFFFMVGVKADLSMIPKVGKKAVGIAVASTLLPYVSIYLLAAALKDKMPPILAETSVLFFLSDKWCLTSYAVVSNVLSELNLLTSKLGRLAMSASLVTDIIHLFADACIGTYILSDKHGDPLKGLIGTLSFFGLVGLIMFVMRPLVLWLIRRTPEGALLDESSFVAVMLMALACGLLSELIGFDFIAGPFFFGLVLPGGAPLGTTLVERVDRFFTGLMLPMCLALSGMRINLLSLIESRQWVFFEIFLALTVITKFVGTILPCFFFNLSHRDAITLGFMMVCKGIYEVVIALQWREENIVDDQIYAALIISIVIFNGSTGPLIKFLYRPEDRYVAYKRRTLQHAIPNDELRILACVYEQDNVNPLLTLLDASGPSPDSPICVYLIHLIQLVGRADAVLIPYKRDMNSSSSSSGSLAASLPESDHIVNAFRLFEKQHSGGVSILPHVGISPYSTMHDDVCSLALDKKVTLVLAPFHKHVSAEGTVSSTSPAVQAVNLNILQYAPCSVGILVDNGLFDGGGLLEHVAVYFFGGADDREALAYGARMTEHAAVELTVVRILPPVEFREEGREQRIDDKILQQFREERVDGKLVEYREEVVEDGEGTVAVIRETSPRFNLLIVGRREGKESRLTAGMSMWSEYPELGVIGDLLASTDFGGRAATLVVQQQRRVMEGAVASTDSPDNSPTKKQVVPRDEFGF